MRQKIKFPNRTKLIEREVHHDRGGHYIISKGWNVPVILFAGQWTIAPGWEWVYEKKQTN